MLKEVTKTYPVRKKVVTLSNDNPQQVALHIHGDKATIRDMESQVVVPADDRLFTGTHEECKRLKEEHEGKSQARMETAQPQQINLNSADLAGLRAILKRETAQAVIENRPYDSIDELEEIPGIGPATIGELKTKATV